MDGTGDRVDRAPATDPPAGSARPGTLTERRRWATEMEIAETAARLFTERGTAAVTAAGIADAAGVGLRTFYRYFPGKEDAIAPLLSAGADDWRAAELARARKLLARGEDVEAVLEALSRGLTQKMLHGALAELHASDTDQREHTAWSFAVLRDSSRAGGWDVPWRRSDPPWAQSVRWPPWCWRR